MIRFTDRTRPEWGLGPMAVAVVSLGIAARAFRGLPAGDYSAPNFDAHLSAMRTLSMTTMVAALAVLVAVTVIQSALARTRSARVTVALVLGIAASALFILLAALILSVTELPWIEALNRAFTPDEVRGFAALGLSVYWTGMVMTSWLIALYLLLVGVTPPTRASRNSVIAGAASGGPGEDDDD